MIFHEQPTDPWTKSDFKLLEAYQILEQETCGVCGQPIWLCRSENPDFDFELRTTECLGDKKIKAWSEKQGKKKKPDHGVLPYLVPFVIRYDENGVITNDYTTLPTRKEFYTPRVV